MLSRRDIIVLTISPALVLSVFLAFVVLLLDRGRGLQGDAATGEDTYREVLSIIEQESVTPIEREKLIYGAMKGMLSELDEYSRGYDQAEWSTFQESSEGRRAGIGIIADRLDGDVVILRVVGGSPAERAGLATGDVLERIDDRPIDPEDDMESIRSRIAGDEGSSFTVLARRPDGDARLLTVTRGQFKDETVHHFVLDGVGLVRITRFSAQTGEDVRAAVTDLVAKGVRGIVIDLRHNGGGSLQSAVEVVGCFYETDCVLTSVYRASQQVYATEDSPVAPETPLAVLVNGETASASEVVASALQDYQRAFVIGEHTYGKGVVQNVYALQSRPAGLKLTTARYVTPAGRSLQRATDSDDLALERGGIAPDQVITLAKEATNLLMREWERQVYEPRLLAAVRRVRPTPQPMTPGGWPDDPHLAAARAFFDGRPAPTVLVKP
jgi:carboxyl-terminal processing protease